jgi:protoheme IX farnesyltransferase
LSNKSFKNLLRDIVSLSKPLVTLGVTFTALVGYILNAEILDFSDLLFLLLGVMLMSASAATFNHIVERKYDALMERTKGRPIASGRVSVNEGIIIGFLFLLLGLFFLLRYTNVTCALLGLFNLIWYIFVYTPFKRISVWAVFVGSITGVIPFFMGVVATGNILFSPVNLFVGAYLLMWQIPHFILLAYKYSNDYQKAGLASILTLVPPAIVIKIYYVWMIACCMITISFPLFGYLHNEFTGWILIALALSVTFMIVYDLVRNRSEINYKRSFMVTNLMQVLLMLLLIIDRVL